MPTDECGDIDRDNATYSHKTFDKLPDAILFAISILADGKDFFGVVRIDEQELRIDDDILEHEGREVLAWHDAQYCHVEGTTPADVTEMQSAYAQLASVPAGATPCRELMKTKRTTYALSGDKLRAARASLKAIVGDDVSQQTVADWAGMPKSNYARAEGQDAPSTSIDVCARIAKALRVPIESLLVEV